MRRTKRMIVWEVSLADVVDAKPEDRSHGGISVYRLPVRHVCHIESECPTGLSDEFREAALAAGRAAGLATPIIAGCIRASEPVPSEGLYRGLMNQRKGPPHAPDRPRE